MCDQQRLRPACAYAQSDQSLSWSLEYFTTVHLLTKRDLEFLSLKGGCTGSSESIHVKMPIVGNHMSRLMSYTISRKLKIQDNNQKVIRVVKPVIKLLLLFTYFFMNTFEPRQEISNNVVCATSKALDQPAHMLAP